MGKKSLIPYPLGTSLLATSEADRTRSQESDEVRLLPRAKQRRVEKRERETGNGWIPLQNKGGFPLKNVADTLKHEGVN